MSHDFERDKIQSTLKLEKLQEKLEPLKRKNEWLKRDNAFLKNAQEQALEEMNRITEALNDSMQG
jgi:hypothetical protein